MELLALSLMHAGRFEAAGRAWWRFRRQGGTAPRAFAGMLICAMLAGHPRLRSRAQSALNEYSDKIGRRRVLADLWPHAALGQAVAGCLRPPVHAPMQATALQALLARSASVLEAHVRDHPRRADAHYHLAVCEASLGHTRVAHASARQALEINPRYAAARRLHDHLAA